MSVILKELIDYMFATYGKEGADHLSRVKMITHLALTKEPPANWKELVDKVALFNRIEKIATDLPKSSKATMRKRSVSGASS